MHSGFTVACGMLRAVKPGFSIGGANDGLQVVVRGREYPDLHDFWDGNWLLTPLSARSGSVRLDLPDAMLRADEIAGFRDGLRSGTARLRSLEEWVSVTVTEDRTGTYRATGEVRRHPAAPDGLSFVVDLTPSDVRTLQDELDDVVAAFPVRGADREV